MNANQEPANSLRLSSIGLILLSTFFAIALSATLIMATDFVLLIFLSMLFGVFLTHNSHLLDKYLNLGYRWGLVTILTALIAASVGGTLLFGVKIERRVKTMSKNIDETAGKIDRWLRRHPIAESAARKIPFAREIFQRRSDVKKPQDDDSSLGDEPYPTELAESLVEEATGTSKSNRNDAETNEKSKVGVRAEIARSVAGRVFQVLGRMMGTTFGFVANLGLIFFMGAFFAVNPTLYRDGFAKLFPTERRTRVSEVMDLMSESMFAWLNGQFITMTITGVGTGGCLWLLGVPMPVSIGIVTAMLTFVPNVGALIALSLAMMMAASQGPTTVVWVVVVYGVLQLLESNIITPVVQQQKTSIPPALLLGFQIIIGSLTGFLGLLVATPFLAAALVGVREFWVRDVLRDSEV